MTNFKNFPNFGLDETFVLKNIKRKIFWNYNVYPHCLVFGGTGSGKTYFTKSLLGSISLHIPNAKLTICDYKADDFCFLDGLKNYYAFDNCMTGLKNFYNEFENRQNKSDMSREFKMLVFDEWASFLNNLEKKEADKAKKMLSTLLMLGRSFNIHVLICQQRADAKYFDTARDNFSVIVAMGNISKESVQMFFGDFKEHIKHDRRCGTGYIYIDGNGLFSLFVPTVQNDKKLMWYIKHAVM